MTRRIFRFGLSGGDAVWNAKNETNDRPEPPTQLLAAGHIIETRLKQLEEMLKDASRIESDTVPLTKLQGCGELTEVDPIDYRSRATAQQHYQASMMAQQQKTELGNIGLGPLPMSSIDEMLGAQRSSGMGSSLYRPGVTW